MAELSVLLDERQVRFPAKPRVHRQPGGDRPRVLRVDARIRAAIADENPVALGERLRASNHEVR